MKLYEATVTYSILIAMDEPDFDFAAEKLSEVVKSDTCVYPSEILLALGDPALGRTNDDTPVYVKESKVALSEWLDMETE